MIILPILFCGPVGCLYSAYQGTHQDIGESILIKNNVFLQGLLVEHGVRRDVKWRFDQSGAVGSVAASGANCVGKATIFINPILCESGSAWKLDEMLSKFILRHEIAHIKNNDVIFRNLIPAICSLVAAIFSVQTMPILCVMGVTYAVAIVSSIVICRYQECRADEFARRHSSEMELVGAARFFKSFQIYKPESGIENFEFNHPSLESRIQKIDDELALRKKGLIPERVSRLENIMVKLEEEVSRLKETRNNDGPIKSAVQDVALTKLPKSRILRLLIMPPESFPILGRKIVKMVRC